MSGHEWKFVDGEYTYAGKAGTIEKIHFSGTVTSDLPVVTTSEGVWQFTDGDWEFAWTPGCNFVQKRNRHSGEQSAMFMV